MQDNFTCFPPNCIQCFGTGFISFSIILLSSPHKIYVQWMNVAQQSHFAWVTDSPGLGAAGACRLRLTWSCRCNIKVGPCRALPWKRSQGLFTRRSGCGLKCLVPWVVQENSPKSFICGPFWVPDLQACLSTRPTELAYRQPSSFSYNSTWLLFVEIQYLVRMLQW